MEDPKDHHREHNPTFDHATFDPDASVTHHEMEEAGEVDADDWGSMHDYSDHYDSFNVSARLDTIFPLIDVDGDGKVTKGEMEKWHLETGLNASYRRAHREFNSTDEDHDGYVTLKEYLAEDFDKDVEAPIEKKSTGEDGEEQDNWEYYNVEWIRNVRKSFGLADIDQDGRLDSKEFYNFMHPEESGNDKLLHHMATEDVRDRDEDGDGKLSLEEFNSGLWHEIRDWDEEDEDEPEGNDAASAKAKARFEELDSNRDGQLVPEEVLKLSSTLHPREADYAKTQADHLLGQADDNQDGVLSLAEMKNNEYVFYHTAYGNEDDFDDHYLHDEF